MANQIDENIIQQYQALNWDRMLHKELGKMSLEDAKPNLDAIKKIFDYFIELDSNNRVPHQIVGSVQGYISDFLNFADSTIMQYSDVKEKDTIVQLIEDRRFSIFEKLVPYREILKFYDDDRNDSDPSLSKKREQLDQAIQELEEKQKQAEEIYAGISKRAQRISGGYFEDHFTKQAKIHNERAWNNFVLLCLFVGITILVAVGFLFYYEPKFAIQNDIGFWGSFFQFLIDSKALFLLLLISMLSYGIRFFSRNFSAEKNLENVYIQKQKALDAHKQMLDAVQDTKSENWLETQNAVLTFMAQSIFEVHPSGYLNKENRNPNPRTSPLDFTRIIEGKE